MDERNNSHIKATWQKDGFRIRLAKASDVDDYYFQNYCPLDKGVARLTGCKEHFTKEEVTSFFLKAIEETDRYFFLIIDPNGKIIGESVINQLPSTEVGGLRLTSVVQTNSPERVLP